MVLNYQKLILISIITHIILEKLLQGKNINYIVNVLGQEVHLECQQQ